ncbi:MAG: hypothetical protein ACOYOK_12965 [Pseudobdellovibrionaceae bacterium]
MKTVSTRILKISLLSMAILGLLNCSHVNTNEESPAKVSQKESMPPRMPATNSGYTNELIIDMDEIPHTESKLFDVKTGKPKLGFGFRFKSAGHDDVLSYMTPQTCLPDHYDKNKIFLLTNKNDEFYGRSSQGGSNSSDGFPAKTHPAYKDFLAKKSRGSLFNIQGAERLANYERKLSNLGNFDFGAYGKSDDRTSIFRWSLQTSPLATLEIDNISNLQISKIIDKTACAVPVENKQGKLYSDEIIGKVGYNLFYDYTFRIDFTNPDASVEKWINEFKHNPRGLFDGTYKDTPKEYLVQRLKEYGAVLTFIYVQTSGPDLKSLKQKIKNLDCSIEHIKNCAKISDTIYAHTNEYIKDFSSDIRQNKFDKLNNHFIGSANEDFYYYPFPTRLPEPELTDSKALIEKSEKCQVQDNSEIAKVETDPNSPCLHLRDDNGEKRSCYFYQVNKKYNYKGSEYNVDKSYSEELYLKQRECEVFGICKPLERAIAKYCPQL